MSIQTELTRLTNAKAAIKTAIEGKGVTVPDTTLLDGMAALIESIEAGGVRVEQGSVTFAEPTKEYKFVSEAPNIFIAYVETDQKPVYSSSNFIWAIFQDERVWSNHGRNERTMFAFGYGEGSRKYYTPIKGGISTGIGSFSSIDFNSSFGAQTYKWYAIYGVTAT